MMPSTTEKSKLNVKMCPLEQKEIVPIIPACEDSRASGRGKSRSKPKYIQELVCAKDGLRNEWHRQVDNHLGKN